MSLEELVPPAELARGHGGEQFREIGERWAATIFEVGGLRPTDRVLDIGCGPGRMALALYPHLVGRSPLYAGFDVRPADIDFCREQIEPRWPESRFLLLDVANDLYNPGGTVAAGDVVFPFSSSSFDFVFLTSVFTHLRPEALERYIAETARVLVPGGRLLATFFLLNEDARASIANGRASRQFGRRLAAFCWHDQELGGDRLRTRMARGRPCPTRASL